MSSYLVIARKWRPSVFSEIIGQDHVTRTLGNAIATGRVAQAYLFSGPRGVGKTTAARILAKCLNCTGAKDVPPCGECASCREITAGTSVDVLEIDGASNRGVENIQELCENIMYMPAGGRRKVYIIDEVHMLTLHAFNALLKTLEEPPPHVVFIFATTEVGKIPPTILSRCQRFEFRRISVLKIEAHLKKILLAEKIDFDEEALFAIAREADGSLRDAESLLDQVLVFGHGSVRLTDVTEALGLMDRTVLLELMGAIISKDCGLSLNIIEKIYNFGYDLKKACAELLAIVRDMTAIKVTGGTALIEAPVHELEVLKEISAGSAAEDLHMLFLMLQKGYEDVARSDFSRHALEMTVLRASSFDSLRPIEDLVQGLNTLGSGKKRADFSPSSGTQKGPAASHKEPAPLRKGPHSLSSGSAPSYKDAKVSQKGPAASRPAAHSREDRAAFGGRDTALASKEPVNAEPGGKLEPGVPGDRDPGKEAGRESKKAAAGDPVPGAEGEEVAGLMGFLREKNISLYGSLKAASIDLRDNLVEIKTDLKSSKFLKMRLSRLEEVFAEYLKAPVKVVLKAELADEGQVKDPAGDVLRVLGGKVLEDSYGEGG